MKNGRGAASVNCRCSHRTVLTDDGGVGLGRRHFKGVELWEKVKRRSNLAKDYFTTRRAEMGGGLCVGLCVDGGFVCTLCVYIATCQTLCVQLCVLRMCDICVWISPHAEVAIPSISQPTLALAVAQSLRSPAMRTLALLARLAPPRRQWRWIGGLLVFVAVVALTVERQVSHRPQETH